MKKNKIKMTKQPRQPYDFECFFNQNKEKINGTTSVILNLMQNYMLIAVIDLSNDIDFSNDANVILTVENNRQIN